MKRCPNCNSVYGDDSIFCLNDGATLASSQTAETVVLPNLSAARNQVKTGVNPLFAYLAVGLAALIIGGAAVWFVTKQNSSSTAESPKQAEAVVSNPENKNTAQTTNAKIQNPQLTTEAVNALMTRWKAAQDGRNFAAYQACYAPSFVGVKRTNKGSTEKHDFGGWMTDRRAMFTKLVGMSVEMRNLKITVEGETGTVEFDQYFRTLNYADWGPKIIRVKSFSDGVRIVYEELKASSPL